MASARVEIMKAASNPYDSPPATSVDDGLAASPKTRSCTCLVLVLAGVLSVPCVILFVIARPPIDRKLLSRITPGMTRSQVSTILGPPHDTQGSNQWEYSRWGNAGWVEISFDATDRVRSVNDESVFP
jgi:hypothetical protein